LCKTDESQTCTPETNNTFYVNKKNVNGQKGAYQGNGNVLKLDGHVSCTT